MSLAGQGRLHRFPTDAGLLIMVNHVWMLGWSGRPMDVMMLRDGSLLVSDDFSGAIYRITYDA